MASFQGKANKQNMVLPKSGLTFMLGFILFQSLFIHALATTPFAATTGGIGCQYGDQVGRVNGFAATFYSYPNQGTAAGNTDDGSVSTAFFETGYSQYGLQGSTTGVTMPSINYNYAFPEFVIFDIFGVSITVQHFVLELDGYFYATSSGVYTLELNNIDDYAAIWFGKGLDCCQTTSSDNSIPPDFATGRSFGTDTNGESSYSIYLSAGSYYPIKIRYVNVVTRSALGFSVVDPSGHSITNFDGYVYQFVDIGGSCTSVSATLPLESTTGATSITPTTFDTTYTPENKTTSTTGLSTTPSPLSTTTVTTDVTSISTTTAATTYTSQNKTITSSVVIVEEPSSTTDLKTTSQISTITVTTDVSSVTTTTMATSYTSENKTITSSIVVVKEPSITLSSSSVDFKTFAFYDNSTLSTSSSVEQEPTLTLSVTTNVERSSTATQITTLIQNGRISTTTIIMVEEPKTSEDGALSGISAITGSTEAFSSPNAYGNSEVFRSTESESGSNHFGDIVDAASSATQTSSRNFHSTTANIESIRGQSNGESVTAPKVPHFSVASEKDSSVILTTSASTSSEIPALSSEISIYKGEAAEATYGFQMIISVLAVMLMGL